MPTRWPPSRWPPYRGLQVQATRKAGIAEACLKAALGVLSVIAVLVVFGTELTTSNPLDEGMARAGPPGPVEPAPTAVWLGSTQLPAGSPSPLAQSPTSTSGSPTAVGVTPSATAPVIVSASPCKLGDSFTELVRAVGEGTVGRCAEDEYVNLLHGDTHQHTTRGLLVWKRASSVAMFTDGTTSWYGCPRMVVRRPSQEPSPC